MAIAPAKIRKMSPPNAMASAVFYLDEFLEMYDHTFLDMYEKGTKEDKEINAEYAHLKQTRDQIAALANQWDERVSHSESLTAGQIIADMLKDWRMPGAVWYEPRLNRFRLTGEGYQPSPTEQCCGVYLSTATPAMLQEDFREVMK